MEQLIIGVFEQGFIYAIMALGVYITYKILDFPDLSVDSTFPLGAAVTTVMLSSGKNPLLALIAATAAGEIAGIFCRGRQTENGNYGTVKEGKV